MTRSANGQYTEALTQRLERFSALDPVAERIAELAGRVLPEGQTRDTASGRPIGHPLHPALVAVPIGTWSAATVLDLTFGDAAAAKRLVGLGILAAAPAAVTGANDWLSTSGAERRVGLVHALLNDAALALYVASWLNRRRGRRVKGAALALGGLALTGTSGWLGGHLAYALGVGVDTTAFQHLPAEWTDAAADADVPEHGAVAAQVAGVPVLLARVGGRVVAIADRCTHRGGALHTGDVADGCVRCPLHGSTFNLSDGTVVSGPATRPAASLETRCVDGRIQVRRMDEPRRNRTSPAGV